MIDGIGAFDLVSHGAMLEGLRTFDGGDAALPFVKQFCGSTSRFCVSHEIVQGEGGEQGDPLVPALFALGLHQVLVAVQAGLLPSERLFAFLDDSNVVCRPDRVADVHASLQAEFWHHARMQVHQGKTQLWNRDGVTPRGIAARIEDEDAIVWRGDPAKILGTPLGHAVFVQDSTSHDVLLERIRQSPTSKWRGCWFSVRANYNLHVVHPDLAHPFAEQHDAKVCLALKVTI